jgi:hypothetical protein
MDKGRKKLLKQVPTRKLLASIRKDIRKVVASANRKKK